MSYQEALRREVSRRWGIDTADCHVTVCGNVRFATPMAGDDDEEEWYYITHHNERVELPIRPSLGWALYDVPPPECVAAIICQRPGFIYIYPCGQDVGAQARAWAERELADAAAALERRASVS